MPSLKDRLTEILIHNKLISREQLDQALNVQKEKGGRLSDIIVSLKFIKENELISTIGSELGFPLVDLKRFKLDPGIIKTIPVETARRYQVLPLSKMGDTVTLAMADPLDIFAIDHIETLTACKISPIIASGQDILQAIELVYPEAAKGIIDDLVKEMSASSIEFIREEGEALPSDKELDRISRSATVIQAVNLILEDAVKKKSSDILIEPFEKALRVRYRVDGILQEQKAPPRQMYASIVSRVKVICDLKIAEHRLPQGGRFKARIMGREIDFRVSILPSSFGEKVAIRLLDRMGVMLDIDKLGFSPQDSAKLKKVSAMPQGMILACGPAGSGKTATLYSALKFVDSPEKNIITVEDPVEYQLEGINQVTVRPDIGLTFASALRSISRQDPDIIMIGEIRDYETVDIAIKSALTGHLVFSTLHTTTACGSIMRLVNMGVEPYLINSAVICVMAQRLVRRICPQCKESYPARKEITDTLKLNISKARKPKFFRGRGCAFCFNTGYSGRMVISEILLMSAKIRELIINRCQEHLLKKQARLEGMETLRENGFRAVLSGSTTVEEVLRVTAPDE